MLGVRRLEEKDGSPCRDMGRGSWACKVSWGIEEALWVLGWVEGGGCLQCWGIVGNGCEGDSRLVNTARYLQI